MQFNIGITFAARPSSPPPQSTRLVGQMRKRLRYLRYSLSTEKCYADGVRWFGLSARNEYGYSLPGLGDAGDRILGTH